MQGCSIVLALVVIKNKAIQSLGLMRNFDKTTHQHSNIARTHSNFQNLNATGYPYHLITP